MEAGSERSSYAQTDCFESRCCGNALARERRRGPGEAGQDGLGGVYTGDQAKRGGAVFASRCISCHSTGFERTGFVERWREDRLSGFFNFISTYMPRDNPGSGTQSEYLDIAAYIMSNNDLPAGAQELTYEELTNIQVQRKDGPAHCRMVPWSEWLGV